MVTAQNDQPQPDDRQIHDGHDAEERAAAPQETADTETDLHPGRHHQCYRADAPSGEVWCRGEEEKQR